LQKIKRKNIYFDTVGCPKNEVDTLTMKNSIDERNFNFLNEPESAQVIVINTCSFIEEAASESIDRILELSEYKKKGSCKKLIVTGCLVERYSKDIKKELPEVDIFIGTGAFDKIYDAIKDESNNCLIHTPPNKKNLIQWYNNFSRNTSQITKTVYLRIAEGCSLHCTYCIIPELRGPYRSRPGEHILKEFQFYLDEGVKEIVLVAQDTAAYGLDLSPSYKLYKLLGQMAEIIEQKNISARIRVLYFNPQHIDNNLISVFNEYNVICSYIDLPIQHANDEILKRMGRPYRQDDLRRCIENMRSKIPDLVIRTTLLVGFPGENASHFQELLDFIHDIQFDHLGVFDYSDGDDLPSHNLSDHVSDIEKEERRHSIMTCQAEISYKRQQRFVGQVYEVLTEKESNDDPPLREGRTYFQAPEIDGITLLSGPPVPAGDFRKVRITSAMHYDLIGEVL